MTTGGHYSTVQQYSGPQTSAEWIVERPEVCAPSCVLTTLADYGQVTFNSLSVNGANPELVAPDGYEMLDCGAPGPSCTAYTPVISLPSLPTRAGTDSASPTRLPGSTRRYSPSGSATRGARVRHGVLGQPPRAGPDPDVQVTGVGGPQGQSVPSDAQAVAST